MWFHFIPARQTQGVNKAGYFEGSEKVLSTILAVWVLTCLWGTAGQCREGQIHDIAADDRGL